MSIDQVTPIELPDFDTRPLMNEQFRKWVEQRRAELGRGCPIGELSHPRVTRLLATGTVLCLPPDERLRRRHHHCD